MNVLLINTKNASLSLCLHVKSRKPHWLLQTWVLCVLSYFSHSHFWKYFFNSKSAPNSEIFREEKFLRQHWWRKPARFKGWQDTSQAQAICSDCIPCSGWLVIWEKFALWNDLIIDRPAIHQEWTFYIPQGGVLGDSVTPSCLMILVDPWFSLLLKNPQYLSSLESPWE